MGLLYANGVRLHDDDQELIERLSRAERRGRQIVHQLVTDGEIYADIFDPRDGSQSRIAGAMRAFRRGGAARESGSGR